MEYGLTEKGFVAKPFAVILEEERQAWKATFGYEIDTSTDTPEGAYIGVQAAKLVQLWEMMEGLYAAGDADTASGIYLDRLVSFVNVERKAAEATQVYAALWGDEGTELKAGHLSKMSSTGDHFALQGDVVVNRERLLGFGVKIIELAAGTYTLSIDGRIISYSSEEEEDEESIQEGLLAAIEETFPDIFEAVNNGGDGLEIHVKAGIVPFVLFCDDPKIKIVSLGALGIYRAIVAGALFVSIGSLDKIVSNVSGIESIVNYASGITGREKESDAELRIEKNSRQKQASGNELAIKNEIEKIPGVMYCRVYSNRTMVPIEGRPAKSYEAIVVGGIDQKIAETIFEKGPGGIEPFGSTIVRLKDSQGFPWDIGFSRPQNKYVWVMIAIQKNLEETFPANGIELIKNNIDTWAAEEQGVGVDIIYQKLNKPIYEVPGIKTADIKIAVTDTLTPPEEEEYASANIDITERQIALFDKSRIIISEIA